MTTTKTVNYTTEQTTAILADYAAGMSVEAIAEKVGRSGRSIIAKLSREGVYKAKEKAVGKTAERKADLADKICKAGNLTMETSEELQKLTRQTLMNLLAAVSRD